MKILLKNGIVVDAKNNIFEKLDLLICDNIILKMDKQILEDADQIINCDNNWIVPGLVDLHVHLREPGFTHKETIKTGGLSAAKGGVTTMCAMPNTNPTIDNRYMVECQILKAKEESLVNILPIGAITKGQAGQELAPISDMKFAGACGISEDGKTVENAKLFMDALEICKELDFLMFSHCEDMNLKNDGVVHQGIASQKFNVRGISKETEDLITSRDIFLAKNLQARLHICHVSTDESVEIIRQGKKFNKNLSAEVCPHHFALCDEDITSDDGNFKMSPPIRDKQSVEALIKGLKDGTIDCIATDHAPHHKNEKNQGLIKSANGIVGLETLVPLTITELVKTNILTPLEFVEKTSLRPCEILGIDKGVLEVGKIADIAIIDVENMYKIDINSFASKSNNSPFHGKEVFGKVLYTFVNGNLVYSKEA